MVSDPYAGLGHLCGMKPPECGAVSSSLRMVPLAAVFVVTMTYSSEDLKFGRSASFPCQWLITCSAVSEVNKTLSLRWVMGGQ